MKNAITFVKSVKSLNVNMHLKEILFATVEKNLKNLGRFPLIHSDHTHELALSRKDVRYPPSFNFMCINMKGIKEFCGSKNNNHQEQ